MPDLDAYDWDGDADGLESLAQGYFGEVFGAAFAAADAALPVGVSFDLSNPAIKQVIGQLAQQVRGISETTRAGIQALIDQATEAGWSPAQLGQAIRELGVTDSKPRAALIAVTETARAYSQGSLLAWQQSGVVPGKQWIAEGNACPECAPMDNEIVALDADFSGGVDAPPLHPACRCAALPVLDMGSG